MLKAQLLERMKEAMRQKETLVLSTLRLINADLKKQEIDRRGTDKPAELNDAEIQEHLARLVRQRKETKKLYLEKGELEAAQREQDEVDIIEVFLPKALSEEETQTAVQAACEEVNAQTLQDLGKVMAILKEKYPGQLDMKRASALVRASLGS